MVFLVILAAQISAFLYFPASKVGNVIKTGDYTMKEKCGTGMHARFYSSLDWVEERQRKWGVKVMV